MKRTLSNLLALVFMSFLLIGAISVLQNVVTDIQKLFSSPPTQGHLLAYEE